MYKHARWELFATRHEPCEGINLLVVMPKDMIKFKTIKHLHNLSYLLVVCRHVATVTVQFPLNLVDNEFRVAMDVKPLDPELGNDAQANDEGLVFCHIVCHTEMQSNHEEELIALGGNQDDASPAPLRVKEPSKYML
jgi:hypothetical protein